MKHVHTPWEEQAPVATSASPQRSVWVTDLLLSLNAPSSLCEVIVEYRFITFFKRSLELV